MGNLEERSFACVTEVIGLIGLGIGLTVVTAGVGSLAWAGMMVSAFESGTSLREICL